MTWEQHRRQCRRCAAADGEQNRCCEIGSRLLLRAYDSLRSDYYDRAEPLPYPARTDD